MGPLLWFVQRSSKYYDYYNLRNGQGLFRLRNCIWYCYGAMVQQGGDHLPLAISGRLLVAFWWLFGIVTVTTYSGNLVALLTFPKIIQPIQNIRDLHNAWYMKYGTTRGTALEEIIRDSKYGDIALIKRRMRYFDFETERHDIFEDIADGDLGYLMVEYEARYWVSQEYISKGVCSMHVSSEAVYRAPVHILLRDKAFPQEVIEAFNRE